MKVISSWGSLLHQTYIIHIRKVEQKAGIAKIDAISTHSTQSYMHSHRKSG